MLTKYFKIIRPWLARLILLVLLFNVGILVLKGTGLDYATKDKVILFVFLFACLVSDYVCWLVIICLIPVAIYTPFGISFGEPKFEYFISLYGTDVSESQELLFLMPIKYYFYAISIILGPIIFRYFTKKNNYFKLHKYIKLALFLLASIMLVVSNNTIKHFIQAVSTSISKTKLEMANLNIAGNGSWQITKVQPKYKNYVVVIGESARRDYHNIYGYPLANTPFIKSSKAVVVDGLTSGGVNTISSLRMMLTLPKTDTWEPRYQYNLISLANKAGIDTFWISNQRYMGRNDSPISIIAKKSKDVTFIRPQLLGYNKNTSDFELIPVFTEKLTKADNNTRLFILHLYGSHPNACDRISDYQNKSYKFKLVQNMNISCYVSSIKKTDEFLAKVYQTLAQQYQQDPKQSFSMIYFSDHGLSTYNKGGQKFIGGHDVTHATFDIPLFKLSSDDQQLQYIKSQKSGLNFTASIASWLGISTQEITQAYDLFDGIDDKDDYGLSEQLKDSKDDPAIVEQD